MAGKLFTGSICLTDLIENAKKKHSAFSKANNEKIYVNVNIWLNDELDKYENIGSLQLQKKKESEDKQIYFGHFKPSKQSEKEITDKDVDFLEGLDDGLPF